MVYKTGKDIEGLIKWCSLHHSTQNHNYTYSHFEQDDVSLYIVFYDADIWEGVYFKFYFNEKIYQFNINNLQSLNIFQKFLLSDVLSEIRLNKITSLLQ